MKKGFLFLMLLIVSISTNAQINTTQAGDWNAGATWVGGNVPASGDNVTITGVQVTIRNATAIVVNNLTIDTGGTLLINKGRDITINGDFSKVGNMRFNAVGGLTEPMGTLILKGAYSGSGRINAPQNVPVDKWFLISSPFSGAQIKRFWDKSTTIATSATSSRIGIGVYNDANAVGSKYTYFTTALVDGDGDFITGKGYAGSLKDVSPDVDGQGIFLFQGDIRTTDVTIPISDAGNGFNLLGNPYPTFLYANPGGHATNNILTANSAILAETTLWFYDGVAGSFTTRNLTDTTFDIAPTQGFFVKSAPGGGTFSFAEAMQTHRRDVNTYLKSSSNKRFEFDLTIANGEASSKASVRYIEGTTTGWDNGYDSSTFGGYAAGNLEIATQLVANNTGKKLAIQSLPNSNYEGTVIPLIISAVANKEFTITADVKNIPENIKLYIEDRVAKTFTRLDEENATFNFTPSVSLSGEGRFYIHTTAASVLNIDSETLTKVSIFNTNKNTLKIIGLQNGNTSVKIFNTLGKQVVSMSFKSTGSKEISLPNLNSGVYIVKLENEAGSLNKKIILE